MYLCQQVATKTLTEIVARFGLSSYASAGSAIRNVRQKRKEDSKLDESLNLESSVGAKKMCKILKCLGNLKNA